MKALALALFLILLVSQLANAQESLGSSGTRPRSAPARSSARAASRAPVARTADKGVTATVRTDGAMVYAQPDFDANVLATLRAGDHVRVSSGVTGDYAKFHKVRAGSVLGYIAEIDVQVEGAAKKRDHKRGDPGKVKSKKEKPFEATPILFNKYVGISIGALNFKEGVDGVDSKQTLLVYGLKVTGPDVLLKGPITEFNLMLHYGAPSYYGALSTTTPSGFILFTDALLLYPFFNRDTMMVTFGLGPMLQFSNFTVTSGGDPKSLSQLDLGLSVSGAAGFKLGRRAVLRLEGKYLWQKNSETMFLLALQQQFN